jgi:hypothetical protein
VSDGVLTNHFRTLGFIAQIANVLEIALTMLSLERNMMRAAFDSFSNSHSPVHHI